MFFLVRSAVCIGLVVAALPDRPAAGMIGADVAGADVGRLLGTPATALARLCQAEPSRCSAAIGGVLAAAARSGGSPPPQPAVAAHHATPPRVHTGRQVL